MTSPIPATASEWIVRMSGRTSGESLSEAERRALPQWISADPARLQELEEARIVWAMAGRAAATPSGAAKLAQSLDEVGKLRARAVRRRATLAGGLALAASICLVFALPWRQTSDVQRLANGSNVQTAIGQVQRYQLPDASSVTIAADSVVAVNFTRLQRQISIDRGEVFLKVAHDQDRPFTVSAGTHDITVTGTKFNVNYNAARDEIEVAVAEGSVDVGMRDGDQSSRIEQLKAGDVVFFQASGEIVRRAITPTQAAAWRDGALYFDQTSLRSALIQMNRYSSKPIVAADERIGDLSLTGRFDARDAASFIYALEAIFGVTARETEHAWELSLPS